MVSSEDGVLVVGTLILMGNGLTAFLLISHRTPESFQGKAILPTVETDLISA